MYFDIVIFQTFQVIVTYKSLRTDAHWGQLILDLKMASHSQLPGGSDNKEFSLNAGD